MNAEQYTPPISAQTRKLQEFDPPTLMATANNTLSAGSLACGCSACTTLRRCAHSLYSLLERKLPLRTGVKFYLLHSYDFSVPPPIASIASYILSKALTPSGVMPGARIFEHSSYVFCKFSNSLSSVLLFLSLNEGRVIIFSPIWIDGFMPHTEREDTSIFGTDYQKINSSRPANPIPLHAGAIANRHQASITGRPPAIPALNA